MSISRIQAIESDNNIPKVDIDSTQNNIPKFPVDLIGGASPIDLQSITIMENGTIEAPEGVAYNEVVVNVPPSLPSEYLESEYDLLHSNSTNGFPDLVKNWKIPTDRYVDFANGYITERNCTVNMQYINFGDIKRIVVKTGEFDRSIEPDEEWLNLMRLSDSDWHFNLCFNTDGDYWRVNDSAGGIIDIPSSTLPKYSFENTTFEIIYGAKYINDTLYCGKKVNGEISEDYRDSLSVYLNGNLVMSNPEKIFSCLRVGGGNGWIGAKFENVKVYTITNCYNKYYESVGE